MLVRKVRLHSVCFFIKQKLRIAGNVGKIGNNVISLLHLCFVFAKNSGLHD